MVTGVSSRGGCGILSRLHESGEAAYDGKRRAVSRRVEHEDEEPAARRFDVFINHRGVDTKRSVARLLYDRLAQRGLRGFLDNMSMRPGDRLEESISEGIHECRVAVAVFSRRYCDSDYCLRELARIVESRKPIIPIFYDIKPSELVIPQCIIDSNAHLPRDIERFKFALREAKSIVGLTYDPATGDLAELVSSAADAVMYILEKTEKNMHSRQTIVSKL